MKHKNTHWNITALMPLLVFLLFSLCLLTVLLSGSRIYRNTVQQGNTLFEARTVRQYLTTRVHQSDCRGQLSVESFGPADALVFREQIGPEKCMTLLYCFDGYLRELFCTEEGSFSPEDGQILLPLNELTLQLDRSVLRARFELTDGTPMNMTVLLRSGREAFP